MIPTRDQFGPWRPGLDPGELLARLRSMRAIAGLILGPRGAELSGLLKAAENDNSTLAPALAALDRLAPLDRRKVLANFAGLAR